MKKFQVDLAYTGYVGVKIDAETEADAIEKVEAMGVTGMIEEVDEPIEHASTKNTDEGLVICGECYAVLECEPGGYMPQKCPKCGLFIDWSTFKNPNAEEETWPAYMGIWEL
jgi:phage FluMu protein Com